MKPFIPVPNNNRAAPFPVYSSNESVRALYDFKATTPDQLSFRQNDQIQILKKPHDNWWLGKLNDKEGLVPVNYIETLAPISPSFVLFKFESHQIEKRST